SVALRVGRPDGPRRRIDRPGDAGRHVPVRAEDDIDAATSGPERRIVLVRGGPLVVERSLYRIDLDLDTDGIPVLADHVEDVGPLGLDIGRAFDDEEEALAVRAEAVTVVVLVWK